MFKSGSECYSQLVKIASDESHQVFGDRTGARQRTDTAKGHLGWTQMRPRDQKGNATINFE